VREYEVIVIYDPNLLEEAIDAEVESLKGLILREKGEVLEVQKWGRRRLAYEIKKRREGSYILFVIKGGPAVTQVLDRHLKFAEAVLRHLVVRVEHRKGSGREKEAPVAAPREAEREAS